MGPSSGHDVETRLRYRLPKSPSKNFGDALAFAERHASFSPGDKCFWINFSGADVPGPDFLSLERLSKDWKGSMYLVGDDEVSADAWWREARIRQRSQLVFSVIDVETTGLSREDRVVEIAVKKVKGKETLETYSTLVNPQMSIPPEASSINGIIDEDVRDAPTFSEIAADLIRLLDGTCIVAHNLRFDERMLRQEFDRLGYLMPSLTGLCTMEAAKEFYPDRRRRLGDLVRFLKLEQNGAHESLADVETTARLMFHFLERGFNPDPPSHSWPSHQFEATGKLLKRTHTLKTRPIPKPSRAPSSRPIGMLEHSTPLIRPEDLTPMRSKPLTPMERQAQDAAEKAVYNSCMNWVAGAILTVSLLLALMLFVATT